MALTVGIVMFGVESGIEKFSKVAMPALLLMMLIVIGKGLSMPGASEGLAFMFKWDFSVFTDPEVGWVSVVRAASGQMMFSLSIGMGILITYGSYSVSYTHLLFNSVSRKFRGRIVKRHGTDAGAPDSSWLLGGL